MYGLEVETMKTSDEKMKGKDADRNDEEIPGGLHPSANTLNAWSENAGREPRSPEDAAEHGAFELRRPEGAPTPENMHGAENAKDASRGGGDGRSYEDHASLRR
jgi:hypothetical protein